MWDQVAASYAEMQIELVPAAHDLPAPDARPGTLAQTGDAAATALIEQLGDAIPPSLALYGSHGDNICLRQGAAVFIDWKSAVYGHPFCGLHTLLLKLVDRFRAVVGGPDVMRIRDAYLEPWTAFAPIAELRRAFGLANALAPFYKVLKVERALESEIFPIEWRERYSRKAARYRAIFEALVASPDLLGLGRLPRS